MQYRIVKREDKVTNKFLYFIQRRSHWWNNWVELGYPCTTKDSAFLILKSYYHEETIYDTSFGDYHGEV